MCVCVWCLVVQFISLSNESTRVAMSKCYRSLNFGPDKLKHVRVYHSNNFQATKSKFGRCLSANQTHMEHSDQN